MDELDIQINNLERALLLINHQEAEDIIMKAAAAGSPAKVASELIAKTLQRIGESWENGSLALSQVYMSSLICEEIIDKVFPASEYVHTDMPKIAIAVFEDHHLLGKRIVVSTLRASGYPIIDLGGGLGTDELVTIVQREKIEVLLLSVLMLHSALRIKDLTTRLAGSGVKVVVGGAPFRFDETLWETVGATACGKDTTDALLIVKDLMKGVK